MGDVDSWHGRVVDVRSWMFDAGSWRRSSRGDTARCLMRVSWSRSSRWMQLDDRCRKLRSVVAGRSMSQFLTVRWINRGVSIWLLARTASRTWARCCNARAVRNSESLRRLDAVLLKRRGRSRCWQLGHVESSDLVTKYYGPSERTGKPWLSFAKP